MAFHDFQNGTFNYIVTVKKATHYNLTGHNNIVDRHPGNDFSESVVINVHVLSSAMTCHMFGVGKHDIQVPRIVLAHCVCSSLPDRFYSQ